MTEVIPIREPERSVQRERERVVRAFRELAEQLDAAPARVLRDALPIAAWGVDELAHRLAPWLRQRGR